MPGEREIVVVTGAAGGVGRATARAFGRRGANVGLLARGVEGLEAAAREVAHERGAALVLPIEITDADAVERAAAAVEDRFERIDIWVNCAMATIFSPFADLTPDDTAAPPRSPISATCTGQWRRCGGCGRATAARSCRSARRWPTARSRCNRSIAAPNSRSAALPTASVPIAARQEPGPHHDGADAGAQHAAIRLGAQQDRQAGAAGAADLSARTGSRGDRVRGACKATEIMSAGLGKGNPGQQDRAGAARPLSGGLRLQRAVDRRAHAAPAPDNLYKPVPGDRGAHGRFDRRAQSWSTQFWLTRHRGTLLAGVGLAAAAAMIFSRFAPDERVRAAVAPQ